MAPNHALRTCAAVTATDSGPEAPRRRPYSNSERLELLGRRLRDLTIRVRHGSTSHRQHDRNVDEAEAISAELRAIFRSPTPPAENQPLWQNGQGQAAW